MVKKVGLYYRTIKHLKPIQIRYRLWYSVCSTFRKLTGHTYPLSIPKEGYPLEFKPYPSKPANCNLQPATQFTFLNQSHSFEESIDWNIKKYGKLWAYHLNYFDYLQQSGMTKEYGLELIKEFIKDIDKNREGLEPYPISLRGINWIKFMSIHGIKDAEIDASLYAQYQILLDNPEYHILGNHLLENGCSLLFGAFYFKDDTLWQKANEIISRQLEEQVMGDGGHYERSVMYHSIILERLLDCYNLLDNNPVFADQIDLVKTFEDALVSMAGWLQNMKWADGSVPEVNDHIAEMLPPVEQLFDYLGNLGLETSVVPLGETGYRKFNSGRYEVLADAGNIGPDYVPGHAHSDIFSFLLRVDGKEVITETGTSTYEQNELRTIERSTTSHNTILVEDCEQNEVWSAFRVGRRGHVKVLKDTGKELIAEHDGYSFMNVTHKRSFKFRDNEIIIRDFLQGEQKEINGTFFIHFHPRVKVESTKNDIRAGSLMISFSGKHTLAMEEYQKAEGYNKRTKAKKAVISFTDSLETLIKIQDL